MKRLISSILISFLILLPLPAYAVRGLVEINNDGTAALSGAVVSKTTTYTALTTDDTIIAASGTFTITLYAASGNSGRTLNIKNAGTGVITIDANASETIDGALTQVISAQYTSLTLRCDGTNWHIL